MLKNLKSGRTTPLDPLLTSEPLYKQIKNRIIESLTADEWKPGTMIPSEIKLSQRYSVGISTIRAAIGELVAARVLVRKQGKGTFVSPHTDQRSIYQFFHVVRDDGVRELPTSELIWLKRDKAEDRVADLLQLPRSSIDVFKMRTVLRISNALPLVVSDIAVPVLLFRGLSETMIRKGEKTLYGLYQTKFGVNIISTDEELRAVKVESAIAKLLGIPVGTPVIEVRRVAYTFGRAPVEVRQSWINTVGFHYFITQGQE